MANWKVTAVLGSPIAGDVPYLDAILEFEMAQRQGKACVVRVSDPCPRLGSIHLPLCRGMFAGVDYIPRCSAPIYVNRDERHEHYHKRLSVENAALLAEEERTKVPVGNTWTKSYRLPLKVVNADRVVWYVGGSKRRPLKSLLRSVHALGKKRSQGYGRVVRWEFEEVEHDWSWFAPSPEGQVLMRVLPFAETLFENVIGYRRYFGGFAPPYWHPDRFLDVAIPC